MLIGMIAKTEPTERSNSPQIISMAKPIVTAPTSGKKTKHATDVLIREENAVRAEFEERHQHDEEENPGELGLSR